MPTRGAETKAPTADAPIHESAGVFKRMQAILGVQRLRTDQDLVNLVEQRLSSRAIDGLRQSGVTDEEIYTLVVPRRTLLTHRRARREALSLEESDRVVRVARVVVLCEEV